MFGDSVWQYIDDTSIYFQCGGDTLMIRLVPNVDGGGVGIANTGNITFATGDAGNGSFSFYNNEIQNANGAAGAVLSIDIDGAGDTTTRLYGPNVLYNNSKLSLDYKTILTNGDIGIGVATPETPLDVLTTTGNVAIHGVSDSIGAIFSGPFAGAYGKATGTDTFQMGLFGHSRNAIDDNVGVVGFADSYDAEVTNTGVRGIADSSEFENYGVIGTSDFENDSSKNVGVHGRASGSEFENTAGYFIADDTIGLNTAVYARADSPGYAGFFEGDLVHTGALYDFSDQRLKDNVEDVDNPLALLAQLHPKNYQFRAADYPYMNLPAGKQYGLLAQEVEQVMPELVRDITKPEYRDTTGKTLQSQATFKGMNYTGLIPVLIAGINEQQAVIATQQNTIDSLSTELRIRMAEILSRLDNCCRTGTEFKMENPEEGEESSVHRHSVELNSLQVVILEQNVPNPFAEQTSISYFIPEDAGSAQMHFTDLSGRVIKSVDLEKGSGILTVFAQNLSSGTYSYSLVIDGKLVETKKMVKTK